MLYKLPRPILAYTLSTAMTKQADGQLSASWQAKHTWNESSLYSSWQGRCSDSYDHTLTSLFNLLCVTLHLNT